MNTSFSYARAIDRLEDLLGLQGGGVAQIHLPDFLIWERYWQEQFDLPIHFSQINDKEAAKKRLVAMFQTLCNLKPWRLQGGEDKPEDSYRRFLTYVPFWKALRVFRHSHHEQVFFAQNLCAIIDACFSHQDFEWQWFFRQKQWHEQTEYLMVRALAKADPSKRSAL